MNSGTRIGLPVHAEHPAAVDVHDARRPVLHALGKALVEDVLGQRDVVVGREHLDVPAGSPEIDEGSRMPVLRRARGLRPGTSAFLRDRSSPPLHFPSSTAWLRQITSAS